MYLMDEALNMNQLIDSFTNDRIKRSFWRVLEIMLSDLLYECVCWLYVPGFSYWDEAVDDTMTSSKAHATTYTEVARDLTCWKQCVQNRNIQILKFPGLVVNKLWIVTTLLFMSRNVTKHVISRALNRYRQIEPIKSVTD